MLTSLIKMQVLRPRPSKDLVRVFSHLEEASFPSGHVVHYVTFYGFLFYLVFTHLKQRWFRTALLTLLAGLILLVGPSRVYMGHHWPSDVGGAYLVVGGRTARMHHPYLGEAENVGLWMQTPSAFKTKFKRAHDLGWQCCAHAIGDAAIDLLLDCYEEAMAANPRPDTRHRIEHCEFITDTAVFDRIKRLGCVPIPGTTFLRDFRPVYVQNLGPERLRYANAMRTFIEHGDRRGGIE